MPILQLSCGGLGRKGAIGSDLLGIGDLEKDTSSPNLFPQNACPGAVVRIDSLIEKIPLDPPRDGRQNRIWSITRTAGPSRLITRPTFPIALPMPCEVFRDLLVASVAYLQSRSPKAINLNPSCLSVGELIDRIEELVCASSRDARYRARMLEHCELCRWTEDERRRLLARYLAQGEHVWMYSLIELNDAIWYARNELRGGFLGEHDDFQPFDPGD